jgi:hypothetical protein
MILALESMEWHIRARLPQVSGSISLKELV